jgi:hypothetical protein
VRAQESTSSAHTRRITDLQAALEALREENEELAQLARTVTSALHDAQQRIRSTEDPRQRQEHAVPARRSHAELERRHDVAMHAVAHLSEQLRTVSRELADARAQLLRRDGDLARLVEDHADEIASLRADRVLAEADTVLSLALQHLDPAAALPAGDVPTAETTDPLSSTTPPAAADAPPRQPPGTGGRRPRDQAPVNSSAANPPHRPHPVPATDSSTSAAPQPTAGGPGRQTDLPGGASRKEVTVVTAVLGAFLAAVFGISWALDLPGGHHDDAKTTASTTASKPASAPASPTPTAPAKDPVADIGSQEVNTAKVMKLQPCANGDIRPSLRSVHNTYSSGGTAHITLTLSADDGGRVPCRVDAARDRAVLTITPAGGPSPLWDSSSCAEGHHGHRWIEVTRSRPAHIDFVWDGTPNPSNCWQTTHAAAGTYLVETSFSGKKSQTSFVFATDTATQDQPSASPSRAATTHAGTSAQSSSTSGGSVGGLLSDGDSQTQSDRPAGPSVSTPSGEANGGNGGGTNGGTNAGLFGGSTG